MVRIPPRETAKRSASSLENKITLLIGLSGVQVLILVIILLIQIIGGGGNGKSAAKAKNVADGKKVEAVEDGAGADLQDTAPVVQEAEVGPMPPLVDNERPVRLEVLNSTSVGGLAKHFKETLIGMEYDVRGTGNAGRRYDQSVILYAQDMRDHALRLALSLGMSQDQLRVGSGSQSVDVDLTLILGQDYQSLNYAP